MRQPRCFAVVLVPDCERGIRPTGMLLNLETYPIWKTYPILGTYPIKVRQLSGISMAVCGFASRAGRKATIATWPLKPYNRFFHASRRPFFCEDQPWVAHWRSAG